MIVKLLTERHLEFLSLKGGCTGSSESTLVKMSNCWKSHALAQIVKAKENLKLSHSGPSQRQASAPTNRLKLYVRAFTESEA